MTSNEDKYAILMETNGDLFEAWYYFIKYNGNEDALNNLQKQLEQVDWVILDDMSTFDLDLDHLVSAQTAKEMTKVELNSHTFHRKFDGKLKTIDLGFKEIDEKYKNRKKNKEYIDNKKITKAFKVLGYCQIDEYVSDEDIDPEDLVTEDESSCEEEESNSPEQQEDKKRGVPKPLLNTTLPRFAVVHGRRNKK